MSACECVVAALAFIFDHSCCFISTYHSMCRFWVRDTPCSQPLAWPPNITGSSVIAELTACARSRSGLLQIETGSRRMMWKDVLFLAQELRGGYQRTTQGVRLQSASVPSGSLILGCSCGLLVFGSSPMSKLLLLCLQNTSCHYTSL